MTFFLPRRSFNRSSTFFPLFLTVLVGLALVSTGCHHAVTDPKDPKFIVAERNGKWEITRGELDGEIADFLKHRHLTAQQVGPAKMPLLETTLLDNLVLEKLLLDRAATLPLKDVDKDTADAWEKLKGRFPTQDAFDQQLKASGLTIDELKKRIREQVLIHKVMETEAFQNIEPTDQEINDYYLKNPSLFNQAPKLRASRILVVINEKTSAADKVAKKKAIDKARERVAKGEDFSKVALEVSEDRYSAPKGGDIGYFQRGENEPQFDDIAFSIKPGVLSPVFETPLGYQFLKITGNQPGGLLPLADARQNIAVFLKQRRQSEQAKAYTDKLVAQGGVTYHLVRVDANAPAPAASAPTIHARGDEGNAPAPTPASH